MLRVRCDLSGADMDERFIASYMLGMGKVSPDAAKHLLGLAGRGATR